MLSKVVLERVFGVSQLFFKIDARGRAVLLIAKITDHLLMAGSIE